MSIEMERNRAENKSVIKNKNEMWNAAKKCGKCGFLGILSLIPPAVFFYLMEFYTHNPFEEVRPWAQLFNIFLFELIARILFCITGRLRTSYRILASAAMIFGLANAYVVRFRTNPIVPWDIFSWRTAVSVAGGYDFSADTRMVVVTVLFVACIIGMQKIKVVWKEQKIWKRLLSGVLVTAVLVSFTKFLQQEDFQNAYRLYNKLFTPVYMTDVDGLAVTFVMNLAYMSIEKPAGYETKEVEEIRAKYGEKSQGSEGGVSGDGAGGATDELPNIIVVMNESFADLGVLGDFDVNRDYMPFVRSLMQGAENTVTGMLNVSVCGGNTANTEFEFLTGNTMAFLPQGSIPYQQYLTGVNPSLASHLARMGYQTVATHPYYATGWERDTVYPWMGFDRSIFIEGYASAPRLRDYVSDAGCVDKIIELYEQKMPGMPLFLFQVTMQNHGGYQDAYDNFVPEIAAADLNDFSLDQYLSLVEQTDASLQELLSYFANEEEKTVVVFFGDHQPGDVVAAPVLAANGMSWNTLDEEEMKLRYQMPYVIWANYDIEEAVDADTSVNYLAAEVLSRAGVPTNPYQNFLLELKQEYPVISTVRTVKADGSENPAKEESGEMDLYRKMQYYQLFDRKEES